MDLVLLCCCVKEPGGAYVLPIDGRVFIFGWVVRLWKHLKILHPSSWWPGLVAWPLGYHFHSGFPKTRLLKQIFPWFSFPLDM